MDKETLEKDLYELQVEFWRAYKQVKLINSVAEERALEDEEKERLIHLISQIKIIKADINDTKKKIEEIEV